MPCSRYRPCSSRPRWRSSLVSRSLWSWRRLWHRLLQLRSGLRLLALATGLWLAAPAVAGFQSEEALAASVAAGLRQAVTRATPPRLVWMVSPDGWVHLPPDAQAELTNWITDVRECIKQ